MSAMPHPLTSLAAPSPLRDLQGWLVWRFELKPGEKKPRKVPYYAGGGVRWGGHGTDRDRKKLTTFATAKAAAIARGFDGVGFAPLAGWGVTALDFDDCVADGRVSPRVLEIVQGTYAELSPSGGGVRAFLMAEGLGNRKSEATAERFGAELFSTNGFVTFTGNALPVVTMLGLEDTIAPASPLVLDFCVERFGRAEVGEAATGDAEPLGLTEDQLRAALAVLPKDLSYDAWLKVGMALHHETRGERFDLWDDTFAESSKYTTSEYGQAKWESFGRGTQRPTTVHYLLNLAAEHGAAIDTTSLALADFDVIETPAEDPAPPLRFEVIPDDDFMGGPPPSWIVKGLVPEAELLVLFGESTAGKSFVALDLFGAVARGVPWRGLKVKQRRVVYIAAEGAGGMRKRLQAYKQHHGASPGMGIIKAAPNLLQRDDALDVVKAIHAYGGADVVIVDTFAQATPGANENAAEDMGKALAHCRGISKALGGALVVLVHHAGKDTSKGARGWSGLKAAADAELMVERTPGGRVLRASKQKDGEDGGAWGFELVVLPIGMDDDGDVITSCVVGEAPVPVVQAVGGPPRKLGAVERVVAAVLAEFAVAQNAGIEAQAVIDQAAEQLDPPEGGKRDQRKSYARRALKSLCSGDDAPYFWGDDDCIEVLR